MSVFVTPDEMRAAEGAAIAAGQSEPELMRLAASRIVDWIETHVRRRAQARRFAIALVGPGNNGSDALVALALLIERGWRCAAILLGRDGIGTVPAASELLERIELNDVASLHDADIILDGVYGVRGRASLSDTVATAFRRAHGERLERGTPLVAIDVPSGVDPGSGAASSDAFQADVTLCLGLPKIGLILEPAATHVGELEVLDIGISPPLESNQPRLIDEVSVRRLLPRRRATAHKHQTGTVLVIGGAPTYYGAPRLSAEAAARAGAGLVCVAVPAPLVPVIASQVPELVLLPLDESSERAATQVAEWIEQRGGPVDALVIGPGLGQSPHVSDLLRRLLSSEVGGLLSPSVLDPALAAFVLDADALNWIAKRGRLPSEFPAGRAVLTPHVGELARLIRQPIDAIVTDPIGHARRAAQDFKQTVILKSGYSVVASADGSLQVSPRAAPELATAGTGDVLAGLVGGLLAQGLKPADAALVALFIGSRAGLMARRRLGMHGVLARDVVHSIPNAMRVLAEPIWSCEMYDATREEM